MFIHELNRRNAGYIKSGTFYMIVLLIALGLKYHYSRARIDDLGWILSPTARMVERMSNVRFEKEQDKGFVSREYRVIIAPSCSGVNFLIIAFGTAAFLGCYRLRSTRSKIVWIGSSAVTAYSLTIMVNTVRIIVSIYTFHSDMCHGWMTPERLHRIEGIFIYFFFLCVFYSSIDKTILLLTRRKVPEKNKRTDAHSNLIRVFRDAFIPLSWYLFISIGIPFLNGASGKNSARFTEHCKVVISICMVVFLFLFLIQLGVFILSSLGSRFNFSVKREKS